MKLLQKCTVFFGEPQHGHPDRGRAITSYIDTIKDDIGLEKTTEIRDTMLDQAVWENFVRMARDDSWPKKKRKKKQKKKRGLPQGELFERRLARIHD